MNGATVNSADGQSLIDLARFAIAEKLGIAGSTPPLVDGFREQASCFVTLTSAGELRGCVGTLEPTRALREEVRENAISAAFFDRRFSPLDVGEWPDIRVEVSVLSPLRPLCVDDEHHALALLQPHRDGVLLTYGSRRATFLPQVWEQIPDPIAFLAQLRRKAGLAHDFWSEEISVYTYTVTKWKEP